MHDILTAEQAPIICRQPKTYANLGHDRRVFFGSYGLNSDGINLLLCLMQSEPLDPEFEETTGYIATWLYPDSEHAISRQGMKSYHGRFLEISCIFRIDTRDPELITLLDDAIKSNMETPEYQEAKRRLIDRRSRRLDKQSLSKKYASLFA